METVFYNAAKVEIADLNNKLPEESMVDEATFDIIMKNLNWSTNDQLFLMWDPDKEYRTKLKAKGQDLPDDYEPQPLQISRGNSRMSASTRSNKEKFMNMLNIILSSLPEEKFPQDSPDTKKIAASIATRFAAANNGWYNSTQKAVSHDQSVLKLYSKSVLNDKRSQELKKPGVFASLADSVKYYNSLPDAEAKKNALKQSFGFLSTEQFNLTQGMIEEIDTYSKNRVLPEGQESSLFGRIQIGNNNTQNMINRMTTILNQSIFEIFTHVKSVQENTYAFVAGGMAENDRADDAIDSSKAIISKTTELKNPT